MKKIKEYTTIDAENKSLGRIATEVAVALRLKKNPDFSPCVPPKACVKVVNFSKIRITGKKLEQKKYKRYSGYPGGLKIISATKIMEKNPKLLLRHAVSGMLPKNKLKKELLKNLIIEN